LNPAAKKWKRESAETGFGGKETRWSGVRKEMRYERELEIPLGPAAYNRWYKGKRRIKKEYWKMLKSS